MTLALGSANLSWLGWFALVPLFLTIRICRPLSALAGGALWGGSFCLFTALRGNGSITLTGLSVLLLTAIPAIYTCLGTCLTRWIGFSPFVLSVGWIGVELALQPLGLNLGLLAGTQSDVVLLRWIAHALGYALAAFAVAYVNALILEAISSLRVRIPRSVIRSASGDFYRSLLPQRSSYFPRFALQPSSQPRGPPCSLGFVP
jgi:apolipoprotein N-acyltransferase